MYVGPSVVVDSREHIACEVGGNLWLCVSLKKGGGK